MNRVTFILIFFISVFGCFVFPCYAEQTLTAEPEKLMEKEPRLHFDDRNWVVGYEASDGRKSIIEYVLEGETVHNWSELVTKQTFLGLQEIVTPEEFMENMKKSMKSSLQWNVLKKGNNDILYEWKMMNAPDMDNQHEIAHIISGKEGIYSMRYTTKKVPISPDRREDWIKLLESAKFSAATRSSENEILNKGNTSINKGDYDSAITDFTQLIKINPNSAGAYYGRGYAYHKKKDYDRAISDYTQAIKIYPGGANAYSARGNAYANKKDYDLAITDYTRAIKINPNDAESYYNRGNTYAEQGDLDNAIANYTRTVEINPNYVEAYDNCGIAYAKKGDYDSAIANYSQALKVNPNNIASYVNRALAYYSKGDHDKALDDTHKAKTLGYNVHPEFLEKLKENRD